MADHQAPPSLGFSRQEHWSGLPFPSPMHESEKWKWSRSVVSNSLRPHGLQPTRLLCPWDFPGKSTGVGCHCLLQIYTLCSLKKYIFIYLTALGHSCNIQTLSWGIWDLVPQPRIEPRPPTLGAQSFSLWTAAAAAKSLQSCPTLFDPIDGSPPGCPVPGILQARTLEWVAISFSNAGK